MGNSSREVESGVVSQELFDKLFLDTLKSLHPSVLQDVAYKVQRFADAEGDTASERCSQAVWPTKQNHGSRAKRRTRKRNGDYDEHETYTQYLSSDLWKGIRCRILKRDLWKCLACGMPASEVHHRSYDKDTMAGRRLHMLVSICRECHEHAHFHNGEKLDMGVVDVRLSELRIKHFGEESSWVCDEGVVDWKALLDNSSTRHNERQEQHEKQTTVIQ